MAIRLSVNLNRNVTPLPDWHQRKIDPVAGTNRLDESHAASAFGNPPSLGSPQSERSRAATLASRGGLLHRRCQAGKVGLVRFVGNPAQKTEDENHAMP